MLWGSLFGVLRSEPGLMDVAEPGLVDVTLSPLGGLERASMLHKPIVPRREPPSSGDDDEDAYSMWRRIEDTRPGVDITEEDLEDYRNLLEAEPSARLTQNALRQVDARVLARKKLQVNHHFTHRLGMLKAMPLNQRESPRCWIFAAQRMMQMYLMHVSSHGGNSEYNRRENITDGAELSATYPLFWETFEKANAFYEELLDNSYPVMRSYDEWFMRTILDDPLPRGGTWPLYQQLFLKYGAVPEKAMPETWASSKTDDMFDLLQQMLREGAVELRAVARRLIARRAPPRGVLKARAARRASRRDFKQLRRLKVDLLEAVHRQLVVHLGQPPTHFDWTFTTVSGMQHKYVRLTPHTFAFDIVPFRADSLLYIQHDPRHDYWRLYTHKPPRANFMAGWRYAVLNAPMAYLEQLTVHSLLQGAPVWFAADVGADASVGAGRSNTLDKGLFEYERLLNVSLNLSKAQRLAYLQSYATHAMLFTGVDVDENLEVRKLHVDNSWGDVAGSLAMSIDWFREYVYYVVVDKALLHPDVLAIFQQTEPVELESWDAMGTQQSLCGGA